MAATKNASKGGARPQAVAMGEISKIEAVRRALASLGKAALPDAIKEFVKKRYGLDMTKDHVSVCKTEIRRQASAKKKPALTKPAARKTQTPKAPAPPPPAPAAPAVRPGTNGARAAAAPAVRKKRAARKKVQAKAPSAARTVAPKSPAPKPQAKPAPAAAPARASNGKSGFQLEDIQTVKALVARVGINELRALIGVLSK